MKTCNGCRYARWDRTKAGRLHPNGYGRCQYKWEMPALPASMYWIGRPPSPLGSLIERREQLKDHCPYWAREES